MSGLPQEKPVAERIFRIDEEFMLAGNESRALNTGDNCPERPVIYFPNNRTLEYAAGYALHGHCFPDGDLSPGVMDGQPPGDTRAGGAAIDFPFGEDAYIAAADARTNRAADEYRPIQEAEVLFKGVFDGLRGGHYRPFDLHAGLYNAAVVGRDKFQPDLPGVHIGIESAAIGNM